MKCTFIPLGVEGIYKQYNRIYTMEKEQAEMDKDQAQNLRKIKHRN